VLQTFGLSSLGLTENLEATKAEPYLLIIQATKGKGPPITFNPFVRSRGKLSAERGGNISLSVNVSNLESLHVEVFSLGVATDILAAIMRMMHGDGEPVDIALSFVRTDRPSSLKKGRSDPSSSFLAGCIEFWGDRRTIVAHEIFRKDNEPSIIGSNGRVHVGSSPAIAE
jgi:hypothetical protein